MSKNISEQYKVKIPEKEIRDLLDNIFEHNIPLAEVQRKYGYCPATIKRWIKIFGYKTFKYDKHKVIPLETYQQATEMYLSGYKIIDAAQAYGIGRNKLHKYLKEKCLLKKQLTIQKDIKFNRSFFREINTEEKAYWLGFIAADGNVRDGQMTLEIQANDYEHLNKFKASIESNQNIKTRTRQHRSGNKSTFCFITCSSQTFCRDLINKGIVPNKTYEGSLSEDIFSSSEFIPAFIRGYFDGNGCIPKAKRGMICMIYCNNLSYVQSIVQYISQELGIFPHIYKHGDTCKSICFPNIKDSCKFLDWIYQNATIYLDRKYNQYVAAVQWQRLRGAIE